MKNASKTKLRELRYELFRYIYAVYSKAKQSNAKHSTAFHGKFLMIKNVTCLYKKLRFLTYPLSAIDISREFSQRSMDMWSIGTYTTV